MLILRPSTAWLRTAISIPLSTVVAMNDTNAAWRLVVVEAPTAVITCSSSTSFVIPRSWSIARTTTGSWISCEMVITIAASPSVATGLARM